MFLNEDNLLFGLSSRLDGNMKLTARPGDEKPRQNRERFFLSRNLDNKNVISAGLVHGNKVAVVTAADRGRILDGYDALITDHPGLLLTVTVADCLPLYFFDPKNRVIALAHAGWRGVLTGLAARVIAVFKERYNSVPGDSQVFIGPHIQKCHFEIKEDVARQFSEYLDFIIRRESRIFIDLAGVIRAQLLTAGLVLSQIKISPDCTYEDPDKYFSYRRDGGELQAMVAYLGRRA